MKTDKKGFTLIELLVVIAIIGLLSTLSILALNAARARARDAKRISDVKQIQTALELYYNDAGDYPSAVTPGGSITYSGNTYLSVVPAPPTPHDGTACVTLAPTAYTYAHSGGGGANSSYTVNYCLGATVNNITGNQIQTATPAGIR